MLISSSRRVFRSFPSVVATSSKFFSKMSEFNIPAEDLQQNLAGVVTRIQQSESLMGVPQGSVRLVAVSKTKPASYIKALYDAGHRHFGENYFQELVEKSAELPSDICWHFIGHLQSQKAKQICVKVPNLYVLETVDSVKLADKLNNARANSTEAADEVAPLRIYVQINTSGEESKSGIPFDSDLQPLFEHIKENCPLLHIVGLMTIGETGNSECFHRLVECRLAAAAILNVEADALDLSMGMSGDFEEAILAGSTSVRVGSTLFGPRSYPDKV